VVPDEGGRLLVLSTDLPDVLTDGADLTEALVEAADCLSESWLDIWQDQFEWLIPSGHG